MKKIAIKPHKTRGIELIKILERMGGHNSHHLDGFSFRDDTAYLINENGIITSYTEHLCHEKGYKIYTLEEWEDEYKSDEMIEGLMEEEVFIKANDIYNEEYSKGEYCHEQSFKWGFQEGYNYSHENDKLEISLKEGYQFVDENGNVINATKIVLEKKKKEYPKTYEECCVLLGAVKDRHYFFTKKDKNDYPNEVRILNILDDLRRLFICRDAYWKIAGEEMGLGKSWEPSGNEDCFVISRSCGEVYLYSSAGDCEPFEFPTEEMRDVFYENFKSDIEQCKELL